MPVSVRDAALAWHAAGVSIMPIGADKVPLQSWKHLKGADGRLASAVELGNWFPDPTTKFGAVAEPREGFGLICGAVSGGLEMIEFEGRAVDEGWLARFLTLCKDHGAETLFRTVWTGHRQKSPTGGIHVVYRVEGGIAKPNTKLARRPATAAELAVKPDDLFKVMIETRGEGGYFVAAPSGGRTHPTGLPWELVCGEIGSVPTITADDRDLLYALASMLDEMPVQESRVARVAVERGATPGAEATSALDAFEAVTDWADILEPHGWTYLRTDDEGTRYWLRPGKRANGAGGDPSFSQSATTGGARGMGRDRLYVFSTSTVFEAERSYTKAGAYAVLEHGGDHKAAQRALAGMGFGRPAAADWASAERLQWAAEREEKIAAEIRTRAEEARKALENPFATEAQIEAATAVLAAAKEAVVGKRFYASDELDEIEPPTPLITGILDVASTAILSGMFGTYKTFCAVAWACCVATGKAWGQHTVPQARNVLYVAAEGAPGLNMRVKAWAKAYGEHPGSRLVVFPRPVRVMDDEALYEIEQFVHDNEIGLLVLDTMRRMTPGIEENSSTEMGAAMAQVDGIRERQQCSILWVHHTGHIGSRTRGTSSIEDDSDICWIIELESGDSRQADNKRILKQRKVKDGELAADRVLVFKEELVETRRGQKKSGWVEVAPGEHTGGRKKVGEPANTDLVDRRIINAVMQGATSGNAIHEQVRGTRTVCLDRVQALVELGILKRSQGKLTVANLEHRTAWGGQELFERLHSLPSVTDPN